jgi:type II secretory pathway pseudopilin PulG
MKKTGTAAFVLVEALVASAIISVVLAAGVSAFLLSVRTSLGNAQEVQSAFLAEEGLEAIRILRDNGWTSNIATQTSSSTFYLAWSGTTWLATSSNRYIDSTFERKVAFYDVYRDSNQDITSSGGTLDSNTKKVTVSVSWKTPSGTSTRSLSMYLSNVFSN